MTARTNRRTAALLAYGAALLLTTVPAGAQEKGIELHGYGTWMYGRTDVNVYNHASPRGEYRQVIFAVTVLARLSESLMISAQPHWGRSENAAEVEIDYAFAEYRASDAFALRVGQVKQPFGIYTEIFDVGTLRPFLNLPQSIYGGAGFIAKSFLGAGITGARYWPSAWGVSYDVYGGGLDVQEAEAAIDAAGGKEEIHEEETESIRDMFGVRMVLHTPIPELSIGTSAYRGQLIEEPGKITTVGVHAAFLNDEWLARAEWARETESGSAVLSTNSHYAELAYRVTEKLQLAVQHTDLVTDQPLAQDRPASLLRHREFAVGLNYWLSPDVVLKASNHWVSGNRFALPAVSEINQVLRSGGLDHRTRALFIGAQFSF